MKVVEFFEDVKFDFDGSEIHVTYGAAKARLEKIGSDLYLNRLETNQHSRNIGNASEIMKAVTKYADNHMKKLVLHVIPDNDDDFDKMLKFYEKFGFKSIRDKHFKMMREPRD